MPGTGAAGVSRALAGGMLALVAIVAGSLLLALLGGFIWQHVAPRALYVVVSRGSADVVNPETNAFIAADGWFCIISVLGGVISGLLGYIFGVRRYGPLPMVGVLVGGLAAAYAARWVGQRSGTSVFDARLAVARTGATLRAPIMLGSHGALALWPLAAGIVAGGIELMALLRDRQRLAGRHSAVGVALPSEPGYGSAPYEVRPRETPRPSSARPGRTSS